jgi:hypothetical protein
VQGVLVPGAKKSLRTPKLLYVHVPQGPSRSDHKVFVKMVSDMIQWNSTDARQKCATRLLRRLNKDYYDSYLQVLQEGWYTSSQLAPKMSANLWTAMCKDAINRLLKQRGLETEVRKQHLSRKASIQAEQVEARKKRDDCDTQLKQRKAS